MIQEVIVIERVNNYLGLSQIQKNDLVPQVSTVSYFGP